MKYYKINKINNDTIFIHSLSHHSPTEQLETIERELNKISFQGTLIFDLLLTNGNTKQRFFETNFEGKFTTDKFINVYSKSSELRNIAFSFYKQNLSFVENSLILNNACKFLIKKGKVI
ncbi:hypothetical protein GCM10012288_13770 [Malaciobacter pacificus]|uniref:Toxin-antitoxin system, antitoxin component, RnlB family n=1 Tax=Malaciobacter pacificus TaxID=1080223 RepID=A0A5C2HCH0_9BACT|nr:type II toxin-antitoxin system RnlB family antitoxin [Malaciobacter pacificus]QEP34856.1 toxin-antitoxin system, antitoxin component, RnlB family [Malaciobacter pacificus]GGD40948.1 hypothetical protein GCM10012288_13770 [Malaciobacter pacificus]